MKRRIFKEIFGLVAIAAIFFLTMKAVDWVVPGPPVKIFVCIEDAKGLSDCTEYKQG